MDLFEHAVRLHAGRIQDVGDRVDCFKRRDVATAEGHFSGRDQESHEGTDFMFRARWTDSEARLHGGYSWRRDGIEFRVGLSGC